MEKQKDLNKLTVKELRKELEIIENKKKNINKQKDSPYDIGQCYFVRTVTMNLLGRLIEVYDQELVMEEASWIADTGRFSDFLKKGNTSDLEVEPFMNEIIIGRGSIIDISKWEGKLLREQK